MRFEMNHEYQLEICINDVICEPFIIDFPTNFIFKELSIDSQNDPLIPMCECKVWLDGVLIYEGSIGGGVDINVDSEIPASQLKITTDCDLLDKLIDKLPPFKVSIMGEYLAFGKQEYSEDLQEIWC